MSTLTLPYTNIAADTYIDAKKLDANFAAIRTFVNNGGIDSGNIKASAGFTLKQQAESKSVSWMNLTVVYKNGDTAPTSPVLPPYSAAPTPYEVGMILREPAQVVGFRMGYVKSYSGAPPPAVAFVGILWVGSQKQRAKSTFIPFLFDEANANAWGDMRPPPNFDGQMLPAGTQLGLTLSAVTPSPPSAGDYLMVSLQLKLLTNHVGR